MPTFRVGRQITEWTTVESATDELDAIDQASRNDAQIWDERKIENYITFVDEDAEVA